jgi:hypothetical protein
MTPKIPHCQHCHSTENLHRNGSSKGHVSFMCRSCTAQRVKAYIHTPKGRKSAEATVKRYDAKHPERRPTWQACAKIPLGKCARCDAPAKDRHHEDYSKPLEIILLCRLCHQRLHLSLDAEKRKA